ncbi:MAG: diguanylate cyclase [Bacillota bacterium]
MLAILAPALVIVSHRQGWSWPLAAVIGLYWAYTACLVAFARRTSNLMRHPALITLDLVLVTTTVYYRGGYSSDTYHLYYLLIIATAILFGLRESLAASTASALFYGAVLYFTADGVPLERWIIRAFFFLLVGAFIGYLGENEKIERLAREEKEALLEQLKEAHSQLRSYAAEAQRQAITDSLTGLHNHSYFQTRLEQEVARASRYGRKLSLLMMDLDHFKSYNDHCGHVRGNGVLHEVAGVMRQALREADIICRYGGDEFAALLPDTDKEAACQVAERIRCLIEQHQFSGGDLPSGIRLTIAIGIATYPDDSPHRTGLVEEADRALYRAKASGRNRVSTSA